LRSFCVRRMANISTGVSNFARSITHDTLLRKARSTMTLRVVVYRPHVGRFDVRSTSACRAEEWAGSLAPAYLPTSLPCKTTGSAGVPLLPACDDERNQHADVLNEFRYLCVHGPLLFFGSAPCG